MVKGCYLTRRAIYSQTSILYKKKIHNSLSSHRHSSSVFKLQLFVGGHLVHSLQFSTTCFSDDKFNYRHINWLKFIRHRYLYWKHFVIRSLRWLLGCLQTEEQICLEFTWLDCLTFNKSGSVWYTNEYSQRLKVSIWTRGAQSYFLFDSYSNSKNWKKITTTTNDSDPWTYSTPTPNMKKITKSSDSNSAPWT